MINVVVSHVLGLSKIFSERVIPIWNSLPNSVVSASSVCAFKAHLSHVDLTPFCKLFPYK